MDFLFTPLDKICYAIVYNNSKSLHSVKYSTVIVERIFMKINTNAFFRQATISICGTLDIQTAIARSFQFIKDYMPVDWMSLDLLDPVQNILHLVAAAPSQGERLLIRSLPCRKKAGMIEHFTGHPIKRSGSIT